MDAEISAQLLLSVDQTTDFVGVADGWGRVLYLNPAAAKRLGVLDPGGLTLADVFPHEDAVFYHEVVRPELLRTGAWNGEVRVNIAGEGAVRMRVSTTAKLGPGGAIDGLVMFARTVSPSEGRAAAELDEETGLLAHSAFEARLRDALLSVGHGGDLYGLVLVDVVGVTDDDETFDEVVATALLHSVAGRVSLFARSIDVAGRVGSNRLGLLLGGVRGAGETSRIAQSLSDSLVDPPLPTAAGDAEMAVRCGSAVSALGDTPAALVERAAEALVRDSAPPAVDVLSLLSRPEASPNLGELRIALSLRQVRPYAQAVIALRSGRLLGYRGTARWHHPTLDVLDAGEFIGLVSATSLASQLDLCVVRELAAVLALSVGDARLSLYAPASARLLADVRTEQFLSEIADAFYVGLDQLRLQVARPLLSRWSPVLQDGVVSLREAGVGFVLTGVESADDVELTAGVFDELHLSRRLTGLAATERDAVSLIVRRAAERGVTVGATGVDSAALLDALVELGVTIGSGDLSGPATPATDID